MDKISVEDAKKELFEFLRKHGLVTRYYYNCIYHNEKSSDERIQKCRFLHGKDKLKAIMDIHMNDFLKRNHKLYGFFNNAEHSFRWAHTDEGYEFWDGYYKLWDKEKGEKYETGLEIKI